MMIEHLADKPADESVEMWLNDVSHKAVLRPIAGTEKTFVDGYPALKVRYSGDYEAVYVIRGSQTFQLMGPSAREESLYLLYQQMLSTFRFTPRSR